MSYQYYIQGICDRCKKEKFITDLTIGGCTNKVSFVSQKTNLYKRICQSCHNASIAHSQKIRHECPLDS